VIYDTFTKRQERLKTNEPQIYQYSELPPAFRMQVVYILRAAIGLYYRPQNYVGKLPSTSNPHWEFIERTLATEWGRASLGNQPGNPAEHCLNHLLASPTPEALDLIELSFRVIDRLLRDAAHNSTADVTQEPDSAIQDLNARFQEHSIGYQFTDGQLIRVDSLYLHAEVVTPALSLLRGPGFSGPMDEFMTALEHNRHGRHKEAVSAALNAFESTLKSICAARKWEYLPTDTASDLLKVVFEKELIPPMLASQFSSLRSVMESGVPTLRNKRTGHGQGPEPVELPAHFAAFALHLAAANIVFLIEAHKAKLR